MAQLQRGAWMAGGHCSKDTAMRSVPSDHCFTSIVFAQMQSQGASSTVPPDQHPHQDMASLAGFQP